MHGGIIDSLVNGDKSFTLFAINDFASLTFKVNNTMPSCSKCFYWFSIFGILKVIGDLRSAIFLCMTIPTVHYCFIETIEQCDCCIYSLCYEYVNLSKANIKEIQRTEIRMNGDFCEDVANFSKS